MKIIPPEYLPKNFLSVVDLECCCITIPWAKSWLLSLLYYWLSLFRSSFPEMVCKKVVLKNFAKFTGKHLCQSLLFNEVAGLRPEAGNFIKKETLVHVFPCEFWLIFKNIFFIEHLWWLLLTFKCNDILYHLTDDQNFAIIKYYFQLKRN